MIKLKMIKLQNIIIKIMLINKPIYIYNFHSNAQSFLIYRSCSVGVQSRYFSFGKVKNRHVCNYSYGVEINNQTDSFNPLESNYCANYFSVESNKCDPN